MSQFNLDNQRKTAIIIASITGLAVVGNNGLVNKLASVIDNTIVPSVQAQTRSIEPNSGLDMFLKQPGTNSTPNRIQPNITPNRARPNITPNRTQPSISPDNEMRNVQPEDGGNDVFLDNSTQPNNPSTEFPGDHFFPGPHF